MSKADKDYWFKRRRYGYGWTPVRWQGWLSLVIFLLAVVAAGVIFSVNEYSNLSLWLLLNFVIVSVLLLVMVALKKGPAPKWRWGKKQSDNSKEDF